jgi:hypothetical protein
MLIYRVETENQRGMYRGSNVEWLNDNYDECRHPLPYHDSRLMQSLRHKELYTAWDASSMHYGFGSLDQLRRWIYADEAKRELEHLGFAVSVYEINEHRCAVGDTQAVFFIHEATKVDTINITEI